jgi:hypothetical protein
MAAISKRDVIVSEEVAQDRKLALHDIIAVQCCDLCISSAHDLAETLYETVHTKERTHVHAWHGIYCTFFSTYHHKYSARDSRREPDKKQMHFLLL